MAQATKSHEVSTEDFAALLEQMGVLSAQVEALTTKVTALEGTRTGRQNREAAREMTDDDARRIMKGDLKDKKHNEAASELGLSYGQVYSCRLGYTFKNIHKEMKDAGEKNPWQKES